MSSATALMDAQAVRVLDLDARKKLIEFLGSIPENEAAPVTLEIAGGNIKLAVINGQRGCNSCELSVPTRRYGA